MAGTAQEVVELRPERLVDRQPLLARRRAEERVVHPVDPSQLDERVGVIVHAEIDEYVGKARVAPVALDDDERSGLASAAVAARRLRRVEAVEEALGEPLAGRGLERLRERVDRGARDEDVSLCGVALAGPAAGPGKAVVAGVGRRSARGIDDPELSVRALVVRRGQSVDHVLGREAFPQEREALGPIARIGIRLRRDRADVWLRPRDDRSDREELRLGRDPPLARSEIARTERVRRHRRRRRELQTATCVVSHTSAPADRARGAPGP